MKESEIMKISCSHALSMIEVCALDTLICHKREKEEMMRRSEIILWVRNAI